MATLQISSPAPTGKPLFAAELKDIAERSLNFTRAAGAVVLLLRGEELVMAAKAGPVMENPAPMPVAGSFAGRAVQTARVTRCDDVDSDPGVNASPFLPLRVRSLVAVPICVSPRKVAGVLVVMSDTVAGLLRTHLAILQTLADVAAEKCRHEPAMADTAASSAPVMQMPPQPTLVTTAQTAAPNRGVEPAPAALGGEPVLSLAETAKPMPAPLASARSMGYSASPRPRVMSAYDRPQTVYHPPRARKAPITFAVVVVVFLAVFGAYWARSRRAAMPAVETATVSAPAVSASSSEPAAPAAQPVSPPQVSLPAPAPAVQAKSTSRAKPESHRVEVRETAKQQPVEPLEAEAVAVAPPLRQPTAIEHASAPAPDAPKLMLGASNAPELPAVRAAIPVALSKPVPARLLTRVPPEYPTLLRHLRREGSVALRVHINSQGGVSGVEMTGGDKNFLEAADQAVRQWRYAPASLDGKAIASTAEVTVRFTLPKK